MKDKSTKVISFPSPVPSKADYQRVKSSYSIKEIKQLFGLSEKTIRRWTEQGIIQASTPSQTSDFTYDFQALTQFRRVRELRSQGQSIRQIEAELQGQLSLFRPESSRVARLLTPFEEALLLHEQGDPNAAAHYAEAINEGDNVAEAYCNLGIINLERGEHSKALDNFTLSLKNDPRHVERTTISPISTTTPAICSLQNFITRQRLRLSRASHSSTSTSPSCITSSVTSLLLQPHFRSTNSLSLKMKISKS
jgi:DNA-binding transcriptional MerR regulator